eukprot:symbB.v1.2.004817.t1/scaffold279.1/size242841/2
MTSWLAESKLNSKLTKFQKLQRTSGHCALGKWDSATKVPNSIGSSRSSCARVVTSRKVPQLQKSSELQSVACKRLRQWYWGQIHLWRKVPR